MTKRSPETLSVERVRYLLRGAELEMLHGDFVPTFQERKSIYTELLELRAKLAKATEALEKYAHGKYVYGCLRSEEDLLSELYSREPGASCYGYFARAALKEIKGE